MKNKLLLFGCIFVLLLSSNVFAIEGLYISSNVGVSMLGDSDMDKMSGGVALTTEAEFDTALTIGAAVGAELDQCRVEFALDYRNYDLETFRSFSVSGMGNLGDYAVKGNLSSLSLLLNGYYDIKIKAPVTPYIGAGIGVANLDFDGINVAGYSLGGANDFVMAFQVAAGIGYTIHEAFTIDLGYRYFTTSDPEFEGTEAEINAHNFIIGLRTAL